MQSDLIEEEVLFELMILVGEVCLKAINETTERERGRRVTQMFQY